MKELVVISGKGGTGKTSIVAALAALAEQAVLADCDVDAADLHLVLAPEVQKTEAFTGGSVARIDPDGCTGCGRCIELCRFDAIGLDGSGAASVDPMACEGCGVCAWFCPERTIAMDPAVAGQWFLSRTRFGPMVHAALAPGADNSGKLVHTVKTQARTLARRTGRRTVLVDGSPGIGCPVIASIAGASLVLIVTEPTRSGLHDLQRVAELTAHFQLPAMVCVNKADINPDLAGQIAADARTRGMPLAGRIDYDPAVSEAQRAGQTICEFADNGLVEQLRALWDRVGSWLQAEGRDVD
jgi:MinD superfamily P-loop ATPase